MQYLIKLYLALFHFWMRFPEKLRFLLVGGYNTVFSYGLYVLFLYLSDGEAVQLSLFGSFIIASFNSYLTQKFYVFNTRGNYVKEYVKCLTSWGCSYLANSIILKGIIDILHINPYIAQIIALALVAVLNYILLKYFAFQKKAD